MKIRCTRTQKDLILQAFKDGQVCPFEDVTMFIMCSMNCDTCIKKNIEWEIEDGEQDAVD